MVELGVTPTNSRVMLHAAKSTTGGRRYLQAWPATRDQPACGGVRTDCPRRLQAMGLEWPPDAQAPSTCHRAAAHRPGSAAAQAATCCADLERSQACHTIVRRSYLELEEHAGACAWMWLDNGASRPVRPSGRVAVAADILRPQFPTISTTTRCSPIGPSATVSSCPRDMPRRPCTRRWHGEAISRPRSWRRCGRSTAACRGTPIASRRPGST